MTLSLDDVRNKRFRMARKSGYEVLEVDEFVDEVEVAFEQLTEENANLKKQIEALRGTAIGEGTPVDATSSEPRAVVVTTAAEASTAVVRLVAMSTEQAERLVNEATDEAGKIREDANATAQQVTGNAEARAERIRTEAQESADRVTADAQSRADNLEVEIAARRSELLDGLNAERDELQIAVGQLRSFEAGFRANLTNELREHIASLEVGNAEPRETPALADRDAVAAAEQSSPGTDEVAPQTAAADPELELVEAAAGHGTDSTDGRDSVFPSEDPAAAAESKASDTPRLDALLGDQR